MKYRHLFFDLDHTLWDFESNARTTLLELHESLELHKKGIYDFDLFHKNYLQHNETLWQRYRDGLIKQEELRLKRMRLALLDFKIADESLAKEMSDRFLELLPTRTILFPHAVEILQYLTDKRYKCHLVTNGFDKIQHSKLHYSGLTAFFTEVITSEGSNCLKPHKEIFEYAVQKCGTTLKECIMIGDSIEADIIGAINAGIDQVFVNHTGIETEVKATYTVTSLLELKEIF